ncbi:hypothetical protein CVIRNUC_007726 [Coccomyxa viridis]|uniref:Extracellular protein n=1 Tax=Coccomyxa viridis TaxID=1274662 RepID=A0AAV1ICR0_9CHLO|nr:hypothetical protein CVIRNUC_007726 [Coccomyxa viridis]
MSRGRRPPRFFPLLLLTALLAQTVASTAMLTADDGSLAGRRHMLDLAMPNEGSTIRSTNSMSSMSTKYSTDARIAGVVLTAGGINTNGQLRRRSHNRRSLK